MRLSPASEPPRFPFKLQNLLQGDREATNGESEHNRSHPRPQPRQERPFIGKVVAGAVGVVGHSANELATVSQAAA